MARTTPVHSGYTIINGTTTGSNGSKCDTWIEYKITSQDTTNNRSTVQAYLYTCANFSSSTEYSGTANYGYLQVDGGTKQYLSISGYDFGNRTPVKFADHSFTINHNSDGTKQITLAGAWSTSHSTYISGGSVSATVTLTTIPRASSFSVSSGTKYLGTEMTITVTPASNTFYHKLKYALGSSNTTVSLGQSTSYGLTVPLNATWAGQLPSTTSGTLTLTLYTYSDSGYTTLVGSKASTLTINVPSSVKPTIGSMTISDVGEIVPASWGVLVNGKSKIKAKLNNVAAGTGSTISSYTINIAGYSGSTNPFTASGYVTGDSDNNVSVNITGSATDARGRTSSNVTQVGTIYAYKAPVITVTDCFRSDSSGTRSEDGTYIRIRASRTFSSCNSKNSITAFQYRYRPSGGSWTSSANLTNNTGVTVNAGLSTTTAYEVEITATDALGTTSTKTVTIPSKEVLVNVNSSGSGLAVGGFSKTSGTFEIFYPAYIYRNTTAINLQDALFYKTNDTYSITTKSPVGGFVTFNKTEVYFTVFTEKSLRYMSSATVTVLNGVMTGGSGYLDGITTGHSFLTDTNYTVSASIVAYNAVRIYLKKSSTITNVPSDSSPIMFYGTLRIQFAE